MTGLLMFEVHVKNVTKKGRRGEGKGTSSGLGFWFVNSYLDTNIGILDN